METVTSKANMASLQATEKIDASATGATGATRALLVCGIIAGPLYVITGLIQMLIRPGFDITRHDLSQMSIGDLGWIQIGNFLVTGLLTVAGAVGMRRALARRGGRGRTWGPLLVGVYGLGLIGAGFFSADPARGFPPGTPPGAATITGHGLLHFISGGVGFLCLIAACFMFARRFASLKRSGWAIYSAITGILYFAAFAGIASGSQQGGTILTLVTLAFTAAVVLGWAWVSAMSARLMPDRSTD